MTVINGPPERSRTTSPLRNGAARFCIAVFDGAEAENAGDKGILIASVTAIAIEACFAGGNILNSLLQLSRGFRARMDQTCWGTVKSKSGYQLFVKSYWRNESAANQELG
jgi:hypothetical protein